MSPGKRQLIPSVDYTTKEEAEYGRGAPGSTPWNGWPSAQAYERYRAHADLRADNFCHANSAPDDAPPSLTWNDIETQYE